MLKRIRILTLLAGLLLVFPLATMAQKLGYVDSEFILKKMPEYKEAQKELNQKSQEWQKEVEGMFEEVEKLQKEFDAEEILLPEDVRQERLDTLQARRKAALEYKKKVFGYEGLLYLKRKELVKPVQDKLLEAIETVSLDHRIDMMLDKSGDISMLYMNPDHDYTDFVLEELGLGDPTNEVQNPKYQKKKQKRTERRRRRRN